MSAGPAQCLAGIAMMVLVAGGATACTDASAPESSNSTASATPTPGDAGAGTPGADGGSGTGDADGRSGTGPPPMAAVTPVGTHTAVSTGPGAYIPATYDGNEVINTSAEPVQVSRQLTQVALDRGVDPAEVSTAAGFAQTRGSITVMGAVRVDGTDRAVLPTWYETSLIAGPVVLDSSSITASGVDGQVQELAAEMGSDVWQAQTVTDDGTLLIVVSLSSADDASAALAAMMKSGSR
ncbi:MAG: hypothetical protein WBG76_10350 [Ornithinimicrobium sp.]